MNDSGNQEELGLKPMTPSTVEPADDPALLELLNQYLAKIGVMKSEYDEIVNEFRNLALDENSYIIYMDPTTPRPKEYMYALKKYREYNEWPLFIAIHAMAIKLIEYRKSKKLSMVEYKHRVQRLLDLLPIKNSHYNHIQDCMKNVLDYLQLDEKVQELLIRLRNGKNLSQEEEALFKKYQKKYEDAKNAQKSLISHWKIGNDLNTAVQKDLEDAQNEKQISRLSMAMGKGGGKKSRKKIHKHRKPNTRNNRKDVADAIKDIPLSKARADFAALKAVPCADINQAAKVGNAAMDHYFFRHRLAAKTKRAISYYDWIRTDWMRNESEHSFYKFNLGQGKTPEKARYAVFRLYYGAIHGFKPLIAKWMYCTYQPRTAVLDFSAGWGGRCLGAMSLGIPYIGIDTNKDLRPVYERMVKELAPSNQANVTMRFQDAAATDFSKFKYDMVFTSPPYFKTVKPIEGYAHMPHYNDRADFNARFLFPVVRNTYAHLSRGGTYALNIPDDMYDEIKAAGILPARLLAKHRLFLQPRFAKGNPNHPDVQYKEHIYVWKKP